MIFREYGDFFKYLSEKTGGVFNGTNVDALNEIRIQVHLETAIFFKFILWDLMVLNISAFPWSTLNWNDSVSKCKVKAPLLSSLAN